MEFTDCVTVVTGASSGIGAATAREAHRRGARVALLARRTSLLRDVAAQLPGSLALHADVTDARSIRTAIETVLDRWGRIDVLVNNAGQGLHVPLEQVEADDFRAILEVNVVAPLLAMQLVIPVMRAQGGGSIVNVSSGTSRVVKRGVGAYAASKAAINMVSSVAREELEADGICVSTLFPTLTATEFHGRLRAGAAQRSAGSRPDSARHVAEVLCDLVESGNPEAVLAPPA